MKKMSLAAARRLFDGLVIAVLHSVQEQEIAVHVFPPLL